MNPGLPRLSPMKSLYFTFLVFSCLAGALHAQVIFMAAPGQRDITLPGGAAANGATVRWGAFDNIAAVDFSNPASIDAHWMTFDSTVVTTVFGQDGRFSQETNWSTAANALFDGRQSYFWILGTTGGAPTLNYSNVLSQGLFSSSDASWLFPGHDTSPPFSMIVTSDDVNQAAWGSIQAGSLQLQGVTFSAIPEPSTYAALAGAGVLGFTVWRRRRGARPSGLPS